MAVAEVTGERIRVAAAVANRESEPSWAEWIAEQTDVRDSDGDYVEVCLGADEPASEIAQLASYPHPVLLCSIVDGEIAVAKVGSPMTAVGEVSVSGSLTVGDVFQKIIKNLGDGPVVLVFADSSASVLVAV